MDLIGDIDLEKLEEELSSERLNFQDVAKFAMDCVAGLNVENAKQVEADCFGRQFELRFSSSQNATNQ